MKDGFLASKLNFNFSFLRHSPFKFPIDLHFHFLYPLDILPFLFLSSSVVALSSIMPLQPFMILVFVPREFEFALPSSLCAIIYSATFLLCWRILPVWVILFKWGLPSSGCNTYWTWLQSNNSGMISDTLQQQYNYMI